MMLVLALFGIARVIGGRGPGQLSNRQRRRARERSARDAARIAGAATSRSTLLLPDGDPPMESACRSRSS